ncbi:MAG: HAMP domain-containing sensor histidine kinase [Candidatus Melainabacteria bacterium]|nr:HAMP domain-containing sensor histidine kinase [Candidatus Melainabacteria bacterium]
MNAGLHKPPKPRFRFWKKSSPLVLDTISTRFLLLCVFVLVIPLFSLVMFSASLIQGMLNKTAQAQLELASNLLDLNLRYQRQELATSARVISVAVASGHSLATFCPAEGRRWCAVVHRKQQSIELADGRQLPLKQLPPAIYRALEAAVQGTSDVQSTPEQGDSFFLPWTKDQTESPRLLLVVSEKGALPQGDVLLAGMPLDAVFINRLYRNHPGLKVATWIVPETLPEPKSDASPSLAQDSADYLAKPKAVYARYTPAGTEHWVNWLPDGESMNAAPKKPKQSAEKSRPHTVQAPSAAVKEQDREGQLPLQQLLQAGPNHEFKRQDTRLFDAAHAPVARFITLLPMRGYQQALNLYYGGFYIIFVASLVFSVIVAIVAGRTITRPLFALMGQVNALSRLDDLKGQVTVHGFFEINQLADAFNRLMDRLRQEHQMRDQFVATLTHDLKVPMLAEKQTLRYMRQGIYGPVTDTQAEVLEVMQSSNASSLTMVNGLLEVYRYDSGNSQLHIESTNLGRLLHAVVQEVRPLAEEKHIQLSVEDHSEERLVLADQQEIKRVLLNLLSNAVRNTPRYGSITGLVISEQHWGQPSLTTVGSSERPYERSTLERPLYLEGHLLVSIQDTGVGISKDDMPFLFKRFAANRGRNPMSIGLGLYNCYQVVQAHQGTLWVETTEGEGTAVNFILPQDVSVVRDRRTYSDRRKGERPDRGGLSSDANQPEDNHSAGQ